MNPFETTKNKYLDTFANSKPVGASAFPQLHTPHYKPDMAQT